ncbi:ABC transporter ATP-binding protein [bacterium]|nr:MAG: ABC transporter ATP-binding protein [bacterium]
MMQLSVENLTICFGGLVAVDAVSFGVAKGELVGIIGPNGAGKSTTFNAIAGVAAPTSGTIHFDGQRIDRLPPEQVSRRGIARTFQLVRLFRSMSVLENVMVGATSSSHSLQAARRRAVETLEMLGLGPRTHNRISTIPLADQKRTEIARALASEPAILLLDEMMSGLNPQETDEIIALIRTLNQAGLTIVIIEHVLRVVMSLPQRIIVLDHGRLIAEGSPQVVMHDPLVIEAYIGRKHGLAELGGPP